MNRHGNWDHHCRKPRPTPRRIGRTWTCNCGQTWKVTRARISVLPGAPLLADWTKQ